MDIFTTDKRTSRSSRRRFRRHGWCEARSSSRNRISHASSTRFSGCHRWQMAETRASTVELFAVSAYAATVGSTCSCASVPGRTRSGGSFLHRPRRRRILRMPGRSVRLFLVDGTPQGLRTAQVGNWSGLAVVCPRSDSAETRRRPRTRNEPASTSSWDRRRRASGLAVYVARGRNDVWDRVSSHDSGRRTSGPGSPSSSRRTTI